jgi:hypothetical protein
MRSPAGLFLSAIMNTFDLRPSSKSVTVSPFQVVSCFDCGGVVERRRGSVAFAHTELNLPDGTIAAEANAALVDFPGLPVDEEELKSLDWKVDPV